MRTQYNVSTGGFINRSEQFVYLGDQAAITVAIYN